MQTITCGPHDLERPEDYMFNRVQFTQGHYELQVGCTGNTLLLLYEPI